MKDISPYPLHHTVIPLWIYRIPSELRSQAGLGLPSTVVGDHTGIVGAVCSFFFTLFSIFIIDATKIFGIIFFVMHFYFYSISTKVTLNPYYYPLIKNKRVSPQWESNPRPQAYEACAITTMLYGQTSRRRDSNS